MRSKQDIEQTMQAYGDTVWRVCTLHFPGHFDAQDAFQNTFLKYAQADAMSFTDDEHKKAWLIRVATNACNDIHRSYARHPEVGLEASPATSMASKDSSAHLTLLAHEAIDVMRNMSDPPRTPLYLSVVEDYSAPEIAEITGASVNTVYSWIRRGKKLLKEALS